MLLRNDSPIDASTKNLNLGCRVSAGVEEPTCQALLKRCPARIMWNAYLRIIGVLILMKQWAACSSSRALRRSDSCRQQHLIIIYNWLCLQCFDAVGWVEACKKLSGGVLAWLSAWGEVQILHMAPPMPLPFITSCSSKSRLVLPFWYWLTQRVPEKGPLNGCC